jgi:tetratricopeptide (TPR) repeat protein
MALIFNVSTCFLLMALLAGCGNSPVVQSNAAQQSAQSLGQQAARALARGGLDEALSLYSRALAAAESVEDFDSAGATLLNLALLHGRRGELPAAHARVDRILAAPQRYSAPLQHRAAARKALLHLDQNEPDSALRFATQVLAQCAAPCDVAAAMANLHSFIAWQRGDSAAAAARASQALQLATQADQPAEVANAQRQLGRALLQQGLTDEAATALAAALAIDQKLGLPERIGLDLLLAGDTALRRSQRAAAREFYERAAVVYQAAGLAQAVADARARLAALPAP